MRLVRPARWLVAFALLTTLVTMVGAASAADGDNLINPNVRLADNFYPPDIGNQMVVANADASCVTHAGVVTSPTTIHVQRTAPFNVPGNSGSAFIPLVAGGGWVWGSITWSLDVTIGPQTNAAVGSFWPLNDNGQPASAPMDSGGLNTGAIQSVTGTFAIDPGNDGINIIQGTVSGESNAANWGVCRKFDGDTTESPIQGPPGALVTGNFYMINAGVLTYTVTANGGYAGLSGEQGDATAYFMNSKATWDCPGGCGGPYPGAQAGHFRLEFGTTVLAGAMSQTDAGAGVAPVAVEPIPDVTIEFSDITASGSTNVVKTTDATNAPPLPGGFQLSDGFFYEIFTTASYTAPITVCFPAGGLATPQILHFVSTPAPGSWVSVPTTVVGDQACGQVNSLSPFAVGTSQIYNVSGPFPPVDPQPTVNTVKAGQGVPVTFSLGGNYGLDVVADGYPTSVGGPCSGGPTDDIETTSNGSGLSYDTVTGRYTYHWKTLKSWAGHCRTLTLQFSDGQELKADFKFK
jgi:hypothetical protein